MSHYNGLTSHLGLERLISRAPMLRALVFACLMALAASAQTCPLLEQDPFTKADLAPLHESRAAYIRATEAYHKEFEAYLTQVAYDLSPEGMEEAARKRSAFIFPFLFVGILL